MPDGSSAEPGSETGDPSGDARSSPTGLSPSGLREWLAGVFAARLLRGVTLPSGRIVGETDRVVHLFPMPSGRVISEQLCACCGLVIRPAHYRRSVAAAERLDRLLDCGNALQACGMLHLPAAQAAGAQADHDTAATHLAEASALAARMGTEVGTWVDWRFGPTKVGMRKTSIALQVGEPGRALEAAKTVHPELVPAVQQAEFWGDVGRALVAEKKTRDKAVRVLVHAEQLAPQRIRHDMFVREAVTGLLRQARRDAGGRELRGLAWRMGVAPVG